MDVASRNVECLVKEHRTLMSHFGRVQIHCSRLMSAQLAEIEDLRAQARAGSLQAHRHLAQAASTRDLPLQ
ncbi:hypothetical protein [Variovorax sp. MHTC-1]|uniref:hypothetical protein n=1 Tax=Variovorax sp. MHTC-1 TaxID=2495593 RepID=UPI00163CBDCC|nr:hypothetical protein [Variovorax sp. MHTC-1]